VISYPARASTEAARVAPPQRTSFAAGQAHRQVLLASKDPAGELRPGQVRSKVDYNGLFT